MTHIGVSKPDHHWFRLWLGAWSAPSHIWTNAGVLSIGNKPQWNINGNSIIFIEENAFENVVCEMAAILSQHQCIKSCAPGRCGSNFKSTVGTPYNTNVGVQKIPDRAIWKPVVAKRNNTNPWSCFKPQILVTRDSRQVHMAEQPASRDRLGVNFSLHAFITDYLTTL